MNEVTSQSLQPKSVRAISVSAKPKADKMTLSGETLPSIAASKQEVKQVSEQSKLAKAQHQDKIEAVVAKMNEYTQSTQRDIQFNVDDSTGRTVVTVVDRGSQKVIRQIPDEIFLNMARQLKEDMAAGTGETLQLISAKA